MLKTQLIIIFSKTCLFHIPSTNMYLNIHTKTPESTKTPPNLLPHTENQFKNIVHFIA